MRRLQFNRGKFRGQLINNSRTHEAALAIISCPYFGNRGDSVNERQLLEALSRKIGKIIVFSFIPINHMKMYGREEKYKKQQKILLINLPLIPLPGVSLLYSLILSLLTLLLDRIYKFKFIYIRMSSLAFAFTTLKELRKKLIVKIPTLLEDELKFNAPFRRFICWLASLFDKIVLRNAAFIASPSPILMREIIVRRTVPKGKMILVPAGINLEKIHKIKSEIEDIKKIKKEEFTVGFIGFLWWWQGVDVLVKSIAKLRDMNIDKPVKLLLVGDGPERKRIEDLCAMLKVNYSITGFVEHDTALKYLSMFDVLALPRYKTSTTESNIPIKVIEAWALGVPVIVTRHKIFEFYGFKNYEDLVYCEPTPESIAEALAEVLFSADLRKKLSEKGPQIAKHFDYNLISKTIIEVLRQT